MNENALSIYKAISNAMSDISPIAKEKKNMQQGFQYRGIDDVMNELSPILTKHRIFIYPEVIAKERSERQTKNGGALIYSILTIKYHFATEDGSEICTTVVGEGMDSGDKASNKAMAVAFKYACLQMFCIPTDDMPDPDAGTPPPSMPEYKNPPSSNKDTKENKGEKPIDDYGKAIGEIVKTLNPDQLPYFTETEKDQERAIYNGAASIQVVKNQFERLKNTLKKRQAEFKPIPFEGTPTPEDNFTDDIPGEETPGKLEIPIF